MENGCANVVLISTDRYVAEFSMQIKILKINRMNFRSMNGQFLQLTAISFKYARNVFVSTRIGEILFKLSQKLNKIRTFFSSNFFLSI